MVAGGAWERKGGMGSRRGCRRNGKKNKLMRTNLKLNSQRCVGGRKKRGGTLEGFPENGVVVLKMALVEKMKKKEVPLKGPKG